MKNFALASLGSLALAAAANANFHGIAVNESKVGSNCVVDVYATFDANPNGAVDVLLNVFNVTASIDGGFGTLIHNDFVGGTWAPQFSNNPALDTFCVIGGDANFGNSTNADPNWGAAGFNQVPIPNLAGWFNSNPPNLQGKAAAVNLFNKKGENTWNGLATRIMRLVFVNPDPAGKGFSISGSYTNNKGLGTPAEQGSFSFSAPLCSVPAPGALALLGLAGLAGGRRRRA